jgi:hypothetical protein
MCLGLAREANRNGTCHDAGPIIISIEASFVVEVAQETLAQCLDGCTEVDCFRTNLMSNLRFDEVARDAAAYLSHPCPLPE